MTQDTFPYMPTDRCPVLTCRSTSIYRHGSDTEIAIRVAQAWQNRVVCPIDQCRSCGAIWEPWPDNTPTDCVERTRCDNCAYGAGSAESRDKEEWARLVAMAKGHASQVGAEWFACHKGIPIRLDTNAGSIAFDFEAAGVVPFQQTCAGFLALMWAFKASSLREKDTP